MADEEKKIGDTAVPTTINDASTRIVYSSKEEIMDIYACLDGDAQFELIGKGVSLDPHDEDNNHMYVTFRAKDGSRLTREIVDQDFILVGDDKCGLSGVLNVPVPPGATLSVQMSTWLNPCHSGYRVEESKCFGVGMVPVGTGERQTWSRRCFQTCIENGVQYYADVALEKMMFGGGGGFGGGSFASMLAAGLQDPAKLLDYTLDVMQEGSSIHHSITTKTGLDVIDVRIRRDGETGESEFSFSHGSDNFKVKRAASAEDMQLYFNCLGWADNKTYVQIHKVVYEPPSGSSSDKKMAPISEAAAEDSKKRKASYCNEMGADDEAAAAASFPDYAKILKADPELRKQVDGLIMEKQEKHL